MNRRLRLNLRALICTLVVVLSIAFITGVIYAASIKIVGPLIHVVYIDEITTTKTIALQPGQKYTIQFGLPPSNEYSNYMIYVRFVKPSPMIQVICGGECTYVKGGNGIVNAVYVENGSVTLVNEGTSTYVGKIVITYMYRKIEEYTASSSIVKIRLKVPDTTISEVTRQIVKVWTENSAPYIVSDVILPDGQSLEKLMESGQTPRYIKLEPKRVLIYASEAPKGEYTIVFTYDRSATLPISFLVKALEYLNETVPAQSTVTISSSNFGIPHGWTLLGYIVAVAAIQPVLINGKGGSIELSGRLVVPASAESGVINVEAISYLIPSLIKFKYIVGAYIVYGTSFRIVNNMTVPVMVYYIPLVYRPDGKIMTIGNRTILYVPVTDTDLMSGIWTAIVVQLPSYAEISKIVTPGGMSYSKISNSLVPWGTTLRPISISPDRHEAYIIASLGSMRESGLYRVYIKTEPLRMYVTDQFGRPIECRVVFQLDNGTTIIVSPENGVVTLRIASLMSRPIEAYVEYRGVRVETLILNSIPIKPIHVVVNLYNLTIVVTKIRGSPLSNAIVIAKLVGTNFIIKGRTDTNGIVRFLNLPAGIYQIEVKVGSSTVAHGEVQLNKTRVVKLSTNIVFVLSLGSYKIPVTVVQLTSVFAAVAIAAIIVVVFKWISKGRKTEYGIYSETDEEIGSK